MKQKLFFIAILLVLVLPVKQALANQPVNITDSVDSYPLGLYLDILEDKTGKLTFEDIQKPEYSNKFVRSKEKVPNYGFSASAFWFKFSLKNIMTRDEELILELDYPLHEKIDLYISQPDKRFTVKHGGILLPFNQRDIEHRNPLFKIPLLQGEVDIIYLRVETEKGVQLPLTLWKTRSFWENEQTATYLFGAFFGILFVMLLYNSIIYISIKDNNYLFYVLYLFFQIFYQLFRSGLLYQYLWPNQIAFNQIAYPFIASVAPLSAAVFAKYYLNVVKNAPIFNKLYLIIMILFFISASLPLFNEIRISILLSNLVASIGVPLIIISAIYVYTKGYRAAKYFIIAWIALLSGTFFFFGKNMGLVPNNTITSYAFHVGVALEVILLSFALADRINIALKEKYETQKKSLKQLEDFLLVLASAIESKDAYTGGHVERVANYARDLAGKAGIDGENLRNLYLGAMVHDVGKIGVPDQVLNKPGKLDSDEMKEMQNHPLIGKRLLSKIDGIEVASNIVFSHQEKYDGSGYPQSLIKNEISREARIVTIADYWDAIITDRPYRKAMPLKKAISIMKEEEGKAFDPELFNLFMNDSDKLYLKYVDKEKLKELEEAD